jgi:hypothetical protein
MCSAEMVCPHGSVIGRCNGGGPSDPGGQSALIISAVRHESTHHPKIRWSFPRRSSCRSRRFNPSSCLSTTVAAGKPNPPIPSPPRPEEKSGTESLILSSIPSIETTEGAGLTDCVILDNPKPMARALEIVAGTRFSMRGGETPCCSVRGIDDGPATGAGGGSSD